MYLCVVHGSELIDLPVQMNRHVVSTTGLHWVEDLLMFIIPLHLKYMR